MSEAFASAGSVGGLAILMQKGSLRGSFFCAYQGIIPVDNIPLVA